MPYEVGAAGPEEQLPRPATEHGPEAEIFAAAAKCAETLLHGAVSGAS